MPGGDRTGPRGMGPMTGRRAGYCADHDVPGYANPMPGYGYGRGWGRGRAGAWGYGWGGSGRAWRHPRWTRGPYAYGPAWEVPPPLTKDQEMEGLRQEAEWLKSQLDVISQRIEDLAEE